jgi:hypothetical protein
MSVECPDGAHNSRHGVALYVRFRDHLVGSLRPRWIDCGHTPRCPPRPTAWHVDRLALQPVRTSVPRHWQASIEAVCGSRVIQVAGNVQVLRIGPVPSEVAR